jgi:hypothetical protein
MIVCMEAREYADIFTQVVEAIEAIKHGEPTKVLRFPDGEEYRLTPNKKTIDNADVQEWLTDEVDAQIRQAIKQVDNGEIVSGDIVKREIFG